MQKIGGGSERAIATNNRCLWQLGCRLLPVSNRTKRCSRASDADAATISMKALPLTYYMLTMHALKSWQNEHTHKTCPDSHLYGWHKFSPKRVLQRYDATCNGHDVMKVANRACCVSAQLFQDCKRRKACPVSCGSKIAVRDKSALIESIKRR